MARAKTLTKKLEKEFRQFVGEAVTSLYSIKEGFNPDKLELLTSWTGRVDVNEPEETHIFARFVYPSPSFVNVAWTVIYASNPDEDTIVSWEIVNAFTYIGPLDDGVVHVLKHDHVSYNGDVIGTGSEQLFKFPSPLAISLKNVNGQTGTFTVEGHIQPKMLISDEDA